MNRLAGLCALVLLGACESPGPEPIALRGAIPTRILIAPVATTGLTWKTAMALDVGVSTRVERRGYDVVPPAVAKNMIASVGDGDVRSEFTRRQLRIQFGIDAILERSARHLDTGDERDPEHRLFRAEWSLRSTEDGRVIWRHDEIGGGGGSTRRAITGPFAAFEDDPLLSDDRFEGRGYGFTQAVVEGGADADAEEVQSKLAVRLPRRPLPDGEE